MRFSMILEMVDRLSAPARRARTSVSGIGGSVRQMATQMRRAVTDVNSGTRSIEHFHRRASRLRQVALGRTFQAIASSVRSLGRDLDGTTRRLKLTDRAFLMMGRNMKGLAASAGGLLKSGLLAGGAAAAGAGGFALFDLFRTAGQFEQYQAMLEGTEGSLAAARKAMAWVTKFAETTPYELDQVMEAFVALKAYGIDPMNGSLMALGDASAGMSKPLMDAVEAIADASTGEFERLKSFSIRARKEGDRTAFIYVKNGKEITRIAKGSGAAIQEALIDIFNERFAGGMLRQAMTLFGIIANIKDQWSKFMLMIANAGIFDFVKGKLEGLLDKINEMAENGELERWAKSISDNLIKAFEWAEKFVMKTDWKAVGRGLASAVEALTKIIELLGRASAVADDIAKNGLVTVKPKPTLPTKRSDPWTIFRFKSETDDEAAARSAREVPAARRLSGSFTRGAGGNAVKVDGALKIDVSGAPGLAVRATPVAAPGSTLPMEVRTGRTMQSAA